MQNKGESVSGAGNGSECARVTPTLMAKPNYSGEKRRKELEKQRKKEEKKRRKLKNASSPAAEEHSPETSEEPPVPSSG